jgi:hypothetical protein
MQQVIETSRKSRQRMNEFWISHSGSIAAEGDPLNQESTGLIGLAEVE